MGYVFRWGFIGIVLSIKVIVPSLVQSMDFLSLRFNCTRSLFSWERMHLQAKLFINNTYSYKCTLMYVVWIFVAYKLYIQITNVS